MSTNVFGFLRNAETSRLSKLHQPMHVPGVGGLSPEWFRQHVWAISYLRWHQSLCARASGSLPGPSPELPWASGSYPGASGKLMVPPRASAIGKGSCISRRRKLDQPKGKLEQPKLLMTQTPASDNEPAMLPSRLWALSFAARKQTMRGPSTLC